MTPPSDIALRAAITILAAIGTGVLLVQLPTFLGQAGVLYADPGPAELATALGHALVGFAIGGAAILVSHYSERRRANA